MWKVIGNVHGKFCKKLMGLLTCAENGFAEVGLARDSSRGKFLGLLVKYWERMMFVYQSTSKASLLKAER